MAVYHALFGAYLLALASGGGVIIVALLSWQRTELVFLGDLAIVVVGFTLLLVIHSVEFYDWLAGGLLGPVARPLSAALTAAGNGLVGFAAPSYACDVVGIPIGRMRLVFHMAIGAGAAAAGALSALLPAPGVSMLQGLAHGGVLVYAGMVIFLNRQRLVRRDVRALQIRLLVMIVLATVLISVETASGLLESPGADMHLASLLAYFGLAGILLHFSTRKLLHASAPDPVAVSEIFTSRYGISPREAEIIAMILQGHSNRTVGERLFISTRTVKNHVYSIYRKTGASNKVQLLNLVRRSFESE